MIPNRQTTPNHAIIAIAYALPLMKGEQKYEWQKRVRIEIRYLSVDWEDVTVHSFPLCLLTFLRCA